MRYVQTFRTIVMTAVFVAAPLATAARSEESKTAQEGIMKAQAETVKARAAYLQAQAQMVGAASQAMKTRAETRKTLEEYHSMVLDNDIKATKTFFDKRAAREAYQASHARPRPSPEKLNRYSQTAMPRRVNQVSLVSAHDGIRWPAVFEREEFAACCAELDTAFAQRSIGDGGLGSPFYQEVRSVTARMRAELRDLIREISPMEYMAGKRFIDSLAYEAQFPHVLQSVAAD